VRIESSCRGDTKNQSPATYPRMIARRAGPMPPTDAATAIATKKNAKGW
jgi:hypothetical protein